MEEQKKEFYYEPSIWPFFITPTLLIIFLSSILIPYLVSPLFWSLLLPTSKNPPRFNMQFHTVITLTIHAIISTVLALYIFGLWWDEQQLCLLKVTPRICNHSNVTRILCWWLYCLPPWSKAEKWLGRHDPPRSSDRQSCFLPFLSGNINGFLLFIGSLLSVCSHL